MAYRLLLQPAGLLLAAAAALQAQNALEIVTKSLEHDGFNAKPSRDYVFVKKDQERHFDAKGKVVGDASLTVEVAVLYDQPYERLIEKNGKPLPPDKQRAEQAKFDKAIEKRQHETPEQKAKREETERKMDAEELSCRAELAKTFTFRLTGTEVVNGRPAWVIQADPIAAATPRCGDNKIAKKCHLRLWIDQEDARWAKLEAETDEPVSLGLFLVKAPKGAKFSYDQIRLDAGVWMPTREYGRYDVKVAMVKTVHMEETTTYWNYHKFQADTRIVSVGEVK